MDIYGIGDAVRICGISKATIRNYSKAFGAHLSSGAVPAFGATRRYTVDDLTLFAYVRNRTSSGMCFDDILESLPAGLNDFDWELPLSEKTLEDVEGQIIPNAMLTKWESELKKKDEKIEVLEDENKTLNRKVGELEGELKYHRRTWVDKLLGRK